MPVDLTSSASQKILLIENNRAAADKIRETLAEAGAGSFAVEWVRGVSESLESLRTRGIAAVLLALSLADSQGIETFDRVFAAAPDVPSIMTETTGSSPVPRPDSPMPKPNNAVSGRTVCQIP